MNVADFLLEEPKSIKTLLKHLKRHPKLIYKGGMIEYSSHSKLVIIFKNQDPKYIHMIGISSGNELELGIDWYKNRFVYKRGDETRTYFYEA